MNGETSQIVALTAYGNAWLHNGSSHNAPELLGMNSTFQYVDTIRFAQYADNTQETGKVIAENVADWLTMLRTMGAKRLWNIAFSWQREDIAEHAAAGFANSIPKAIQVDLPNSYELWYPRWQTGGPASRPWRVEYRGLRGQSSSAMPPMDINQVEQNLRQALVDAQAFAMLQEAHAASWAECFAKAQAWLSDDAPELPFHPDMLPAQGYSLKARQLLAAAGQADVFGGMGSWNDLGFSSPAMQAHYQAITIRLYEAVKIAIVMASNSFA